MLKAAGLERSTRLPRAGRLVATAALALTAGAAGSAGPGGSGLIVLPATGAVPGSLNGAPARLVVAAEGLSYPVLDPAFADGHGFSRSMFTVEAQVGREKLPGRTGVVTVAVGRDRTGASRRSLWFSRASVPGIDGVLGPGSLPQADVQFRLGAAVPGEREFALPLVERGGRLGTAVTLEGSPVFVQFDLRRDGTLMSATLGDVVSRTHGGSVTGPARPREINFGIERPVRRLLLRQPLAVGPLMISEAALRVPSYEVASAPAEDADPGEVVVVARRKPGKVLSGLIVGRDAMARCSSITFRKGQKSVVLRCA